MRPPLLARSWWLRVVTSLLLLMTSSSIVMVTASITVESGCLPADKATDACSDPVTGPADPASGDKKVTCNAGFILESTIFDGDILKGVAKLTSTCYSMCHTKFMALKCPTGIEGCVTAVYAPATKQINCPDATTHDLFVNDKAVKSLAKCDKALGWKDELNKDILKFDPPPLKVDVTAYCLKKKPPPLPAPIRCDATSFEVDCTGSACVSPTFTAKKLSCPAGQKLVILDSMLFDHAMCTNTGWEGRATATGGTGVTKLLAFTTHPTAVLPYPDPKLRAHCYTFDCTKMFEAGCPPSEPTCTDKPTLNPSKQLICASGFLTIDGAIYQNAVCSNDGWKADTKDLIKYSPTSLPEKKLGAYCQKDCSSLFENDCPEGVCKVAPAIDPSTKTKISCPPNNILIVNGKDYKELVCSTAGWKTAEATPRTILDYSSGIKPLKARCLSRCHRHFVDTTCAAAGCNQPIYVNEGEPMFCRGGDQLVLSGKEVADVVCDIVAGWKEGGNVVMPFNETTNIMKAECRPKPTTTTTTTTTTAAPTEAQEKAGNDMPYIVIIILLIGVILIGTSLFCWHMKKKKKASKRDDDEENPSRTKTDSKNKSKKNKKGKKSKKGEGKSEKGKKGKKTKKEKSKKEMEVDSDVEVPVQQMSMPNDSTLPLTLAARAPSGPSPNVMDI